MSKALLGILRLLQTTKRISFCIKKILNVKKMSSTEEQLEKSIKLYADKNIKEITSLMEFFKRITKDADEFTQVIEDIKSIRATVPSIIIAEYTSVYFLRFKSDILKQDVETLLNYNYAELIEEGTVSETEMLIRKLIESIKTVWIRGDNKTQLRIKASILKLLKYSIRFDSKRRELAKFN